jgi:hypothetical protein
VSRKKYESCKNFREKGACKYGDRCLFAHGDHELTRRGSPSETKDDETTTKKVEAEVLADKKDAETTQEQTTLDSTKIAIEQDSSANVQAVDVSKSEVEVDNVNDLKK